MSTGRRHIEAGEVGDGLRVFQTGADRHQCAAVMSHERESGRGPARVER